MNGTQYCLISGCDRPSRSRGHCANHYQQLLYSEGRLAQSRISRRRPSLAERFRDGYVVHEGGCWEWIRLKADGYGVITVQGKATKAHRLSLILAGKQPKVGQLACHRCDNRACVNPDHLYWGSYADNNRDASERSRYAVGSARKNAKLGESEVLSIRAEHASGARIIDLARKYGVSAPSIRSVTSGRTWRHVGGPITEPTRRKNV